MKIEQHPDAWRLLQVQLGEGRSIVTFHELYPIAVDETDRELGGDVSGVDEELSFACAYLILLLLVKNHWPIPSSGQGPLLIGVN